MKFGLLADIHGDVVNLARAIDRLGSEQVDQFVLLGDVIFDRSNADETVALLKSCGAVGVWGNHELGLCVEPDDEIRKMYSDEVMEFFSNLQPRLEFGDVLVSHTFPSQDARDPLVYYIGAPEDDGLVEECFATCPHRIMLCGHFHCWWAATPETLLDWDGKTPLELEPSQRYFIIIKPVMFGAAAVLDDQQNVLVPIDWSDD